MAFKTLVVIVIMVFVILCLWLGKLTVDSITRYEADRIADSHAHHVEYKLHGDIHKLSYDQQLYREELDELKSALNDQGIATGYTTEKKLYYKDKENERTKM